jgi:hypothetical protein
MTAKKVVKVTTVPTGFNGLDKMPKFVETSAVASFSERVKLSLNDGAVVFGYVQRYDRDMNAHHIQAKKGDLVFTLVDGTRVFNVVGWSEL